MAILEKEILVTVNGRTIKHYEERGYDIPKYINKEGKLTYKFGSKFIVKVEDLLKNNNTKSLTKICDICGKHVPNQNYNKITTGRNSSDGKDRCWDCGQIYRGANQKKNVSYERSLEFFAKENGKEYLLDEFSNKNEKRPNKISFRTNDEYLWNCPVCKSEYSSIVSNRTTGHNCPYCAGKKVNELNSLAINYPLIAEEWHPTKNGNITPNDITYGSDKKCWWKCKESHEWKMAVKCRTLQSQGCPICSETKGEKRIRKWLEENNVYFESQKEFIGLTGLGGRLLSYDFYLLRQNLLIEYQGEFHDGSGSKNGFTKINLKKQKEHDRRKREFAEIHGIELLEIWYWDYENIEGILNNAIRNYLKVN